MSERILTPNERTASAFFRWRLDMGDDCVKAVVRTKALVAKRLLDIDSDLSDDFYSWLIS